eukprot:CAMPEP_0113679662 /NCGR_PEP_ID=MMETSP0038_2-20120614/10791_1 /TAXON_ID=2898 /ORGANISM="Cryptomonas paramecium" /LENGTH=74 /DNA_ID=CAMNT_0000597763 /DNA_START=180 /DNA_END=401 /DNA_ORIENTATION=- /assembly_acc=CAM_ASM_000170
MLSDNSEGKYKPALIYERLPSKKSPKHPCKSKIPGFQSNKIVPVFEKPVSGIQEALKAAFESKVSQQRLNARKW